MRTLQVQYNQKGKVWLDDITLPDWVTEPKRKADIQRTFIFNILYRRYEEKIRDFEIIKYYN